MKENQIVASRNSTKPRILRSVVAALALAALLLVAVFASMPFGIAKALQGDITSGAQYGEPEAAGGPASTAHLSVDKTEFTVGEPIMVTPTVQTEGAKDWVAIMHESATHVYITYRYVEVGAHTADDLNGLGSGVAFDITKAHKNGNSGYTDFPAGNYYVSFIPSNGSANGKVTERIKITVKEETQTPDEPVLSTAHMSIEKTEFEEGEPIIVTPTVQTSGAKDWLGIMPEEARNTYITYMYVETGAGSGDAAGKGSGVAVDITKGARNKTAPAPNYYNFPIGTYYLSFIPNNGSAVSGITETLKITVIEKSEPPAPVLETAHLKIEKNTFYVGEPIMVTPKVQTAGAKDWVAIMHESNNYTYITAAYIDEQTSNGWNGHGDGVAFDIRTGNKNNTAPAPDFHSFPAGKYIISFIPNNKGAAGNVTETLNITILPVEAAKAPTNAVYTLDNATDGLAGGTLAVTIDGYADIDKYVRPTDVVMYWADNDGTPLADYTAIAKRKITGETTNITLFSNAIIPAEAKKLLIYTMNANGLSETCFAVTLPANSQYANSDELLYEFQVVSDLQLQDNENHAYNLNYERMLLDVATVSPDSKGIVIVGDVVDTATDTQYGNFKRTYNSVKAEHENLAPLYITIGNHEFKNGTLAAYGNPEERIETFLTQISAVNAVQTDKVYYDAWIGGNHYIFLGSEYCEEASDANPAGSGTDTFLSDEQLAWLEAKLDEDKATGRPTFLFVHASLYNTVAGSLDGQGWSGIVAGGEPRQNIAKSGDEELILEAEQKLRDILKKHPEVLMFSGHSHWLMDSQATMYVKDENLPYLFNTSAVGYTYTDYNGNGENVTGSEGYYVRVYSDRIEVLGRDFITGKWIASAAFVTNLDGEFNIHDTTKIAAKAPTCTQDGNIEYWHCTTCNKYYSDNSCDPSKEITLQSTVLPAAHSLQHIAALAATCTEKGHAQHWHCTACGKYFTDENAQTETTLAELETAITAHTLEHTAAQSATCTKKGNSEYWHCSVCDKYFADENATVATSLVKSEIAMTEHVYDPEWKTDGTNHWHECTVCSHREDTEAHVYHNGKCTVCDSEDPDYEQPKSGCATVAVGGGSDNPTGGLLAVTLLGLLLLFVMKFAKSEKAN